MTPERLAEIREDLAAPDLEYRFVRRAAADLLAEVDRLWEAMTIPTFQPKRARLIDWCRLCGLEYDTLGAPPEHDCKPLVEDTNHMVMPRDPEPDGFCSCDDDMRLATTCGIKAHRVAARALREGDHAP